MAVIINETKSIDLSTETSADLEYVGGKLQLKSNGNVTSPAGLIDLTGVTQTIYVDATLGDDTTGDGTSPTPYKTIQKAVSVAPASGSAIYAKAGTYYANTTESKSYGRGLSDAGKSIIFYGDANKTIFIMDGVANTLRDQHAISTTGTNTKIYNIIFDIRFNGRTNNYSKSLFSDGNALGNGQAKVYNCAFKCDIAPSFSYSAGTVTVYNCSFSVPANFLASYSGTVTLQNCATNYTFYAEGTRTTCLNNVVFDENYKITSIGWQNVGTGTNYDGTVASLGVYGGQYMWEDITITYPKSAYNEFLIDLTQYFNSITSIMKSISGLGSDSSSATTIVPVMTADTTTSNGTTYVASASAFYNSSYPAYAAFNNTLSSGVVTEWLTPNGTTTGWLKMDLGNQKAVNKYSIVGTTGYGSGYVTSAPKNWTFEGSNDNSNWTVLDTQINQVYSSIGEKRTFTFINTMSYRFYRINVSANNGNLYYLSIGEVELFERIPSTNTASVDIYTSTSNDNVNFSTYQLINADGTISSPQGRYVKIKLVLNASGNDTITTHNDFFSAESSQFEADSQLVFDGSLKLKTSYQDSMTKDAGWSDVGTLLKTTIEKTSFKVIEKIEVI